MFFLSSVSNFSFKWMESKSELFIGIKIETNFGIVPSQILMFIVVFYGSTRKQMNQNFLSLVLKLLTVQTLTIFSRLLISSHISIKKSQGCV